MDNQLAPDPADIHVLTEQAGEAARMLKLLANERRLLVLCELARAGEMTVGNLATAVGLSQSALSQHLSLMRESGIVGYRRDGQTLHYTIADPTVSELLTTLRNIYCGPTAAP
ncbi:ArsR/SmtB family transcription factor [Bauldia sp.]|uniref:ArsR/SmtB family transcription factor n=1 Tax=Bauldia sp. TaxID=2575872 RepID=UPI003BAAA25D